MKLESFKFQDGKVFWLPEYPDEPDYIQPGDTNSYAVMVDINYTLQIEYNKTVAKSLASAIEVAAEDMESIARLIWHQLPDNQNYIWQPEKDKVYSAECEMEAEYQLRNMANNGWIQVSRSHYKFAISDESFKDGKDYRQVARLKTIDKVKSEKVAGKWRVESSTSPIADTGDYYTQLWLTNGVVNLYSEKDDNETELQLIADQLNKDEIFPAANSHDMKDEDL